MKTFSINQKIEIFSKNKNDWFDGIVTEVDEKKGEAHVTYERSSHKGGTRTLDKWIRLKEKGQAWRLPESNTQNIAKVENEVKVDIEPTIKSKEANKIKAGTEAKTTADVEAEKELGTESKPKTDKTATEKADTEAKTKEDMEAETKVDTEANTAADVEAEKELGAEAKPKTDKTAQEKADTEAKAKADTEAKAKADAEANTKIPEKTATKETIQDKELTKEGRKDSSIEKTKEDEDSVSFPSPAQDETDLSSELSSKPIDPSIQKIRDLFNSLDVDHSGTLSKKELGQLAKRMGKAAMTSHFGKKFNLSKVYNELDPTNSGGVKLETFQQWYQSRHPKTNHEIDIELRRVFDEIDKDKSGNLSKTEIGTLCDNIGINIRSSIFFGRRKSSSKIKSLFEEMDVNSTGNVSFDDFKKWHRKNHGEVYYTEGDLSEENSSEETEKTNSTSGEKNIPFSSSQHFTEKTDDEIRNYFNRFDTDNSGNLSKSEVANLAMEVSKDLQVVFSDSQAEAAAKEMDENNSDSVDFPQFLKWYRRTYPTQMEHIIAKVRFEFDLFDQDKNGGLSSSEIANLIEKLKLVDQSGGKSAEEIAAELPVSHYGDVLFDDFLEWHMLHHKNQYSFLENRTNEEGHRKSFVHTHAGADIHTDIMIGSKVEVYFRGAQKWVEGEIMEIDGNGVGSFVSKDGHKRKSVHLYNVQVVRLIDEEKKERLKEEERKQLEKTQQDLLKFKEVKKLSSQMALQFVMERRKQEQLMIQLAKKKLESARRAKQESDIKRKKKKNERNNAKQQAKAEERSTFERNALQKAVTAANTFHTLHGDGESFVGIRSRIVDNSSSLREVGNLSPSEVLQPLKPVGNLSSILTKLNVPNSSKFISQNDTLDALHLFWGSPTIIDEEKDLLFQYLTEDNERDGRVEKRKLLSLDPGYTKKLSCTPIHSQSFLTIKIEECVLNFDFDEQKKYALYCRSNFHEKKYFYKSNFRKMRRNERDEIEWNVSIAKQINEKFEKTKVNVLIFEIREETQSKPTYIGLFDLSDHDFINAETMDIWIPLLENEARPLFTINSVSYEPQSIQLLHARQTKIPLLHFKLQYFDVEHFLQLKKNMPKMLLNAKRNHFGLKEDHRVQLRDVEADQQLQKQLNSKCNVVELQKNLEIENFKFQKDLHISMQEKVMKERQNMIKTLIKQMETIRDNAKAYEVQSFNVNLKPSLPLPNFNSFAENQLKIQHEENLSNLRSKAINDRKELKQSLLDHYTWNAMEIRKRFHKSTQHQLTLETNLHQCREKFCKYHYSFPFSKKLDEEKKCLFKQYHENNDTERLISFRNIRQSIDILNGERKKRLEKFSNDFQDKVQTRLSGIEQGWYRELENQRNLLEEEFYDLVQDTKSDLIVTLEERRENLKNARKRNEELQQEVNELQEMLQDVTTAR
eukprot:g5580.t1